MYIYFHFLICSYDYTNWLWSLKSSLKKYSTNIVHSHNTNRITYSMIQILQIYIKNFYRQLSKYSQRWQIRYTVSYHLFSFNHPQNYIPRWRSDKNRNNDRRSKRKWTRYLDDRINDVTRKRGRCGAQDWSNWILRGYLHGRNIL